MVDAGARGSAVERTTAGVGDREGAGVEGDEPVADQPLHELGERLMPGLIEEQAVGVELAHRQRAALLHEEREKTAASGRHVGGHGDPCSTSAAARTPAADRALED